MDSVAVIIPTVDGREAYLERCIAAYEATATSREGVRVHTVVVRNRPSCGAAWQEGVEHVLGKRGSEHAGFDAAASAGRGGITHIHLTADDLVPHESWWSTARALLADGIIPAPLVYNPDGVTVQSCGGSGDGDLWPLTADGTPCSWCAIPICTVEQWQVCGPMIPIHYYSDDWFSHRALAGGLGMQVAQGYAFTHFNAMPGRGAGMTQHERAAMDRATFQQHLTGDIAPCTAPHSASS